MAEPVTIRNNPKSDGNKNLTIVEAAGDFYGPGQILLVIGGDGDSVDIVADRRELEAALIVATGQRCSSSTGDLHSCIGYPERWNERLLAERYQPPEHWETIPVADVIIGDTVRGDTGSREFEVTELRIQTGTIGLLGDDMATWRSRSRGTVERLVKP